MTVRHDKTPTFLGREALARRQGDGLKKRLVSFTLDDPTGFPVGDEPILRGGQMVGWLTSAAYGHTLGRAVGMGYVRNPDGVDRTWIEAGAYEIDIAGERYRATPHLRAPLDPTGSRIRG